MNLRPQTLKEYVGQGAIMPLVQAAIKQCKTSNKIFGHTLLFGYSGVGKTTLARCIGAELGYEFVGLTASKEITPSVMRDFLLNLNVEGYGPKGRWQPGAKRYVVFIDEVAELKLSTWESVLFDAMEDFTVYSEKGPSWLADWSLICGTTAPYALPVPALSRFKLKLHLETYSCDELGKMIRRIYPQMEPDIVNEVARRSRGIARLALNFAEGVNDHGLAYFDVAQIDRFGLTELDRSYLAALKSGNGRPMSLNSISNVVRESPKTLAAFVEPELLRLNMIEITREGRALVETERGAKALD